jgi:hypothetical protein
VPLPSALSSPPFASGREKNPGKVQSLGDNEDLIASIWMYTLEEVDLCSGVSAEDDEEYDELDELDDGKLTCKRGASAKGKACDLPKNISSFAGVDLSERGE